MKRFTFLFLFVMSVYMPAGTIPSFAAEAPAALSAHSVPPASTETVDTVDRLAKEVLKHFPRAEGHVTFALGQKVTVDIGASDGLTAGMELLLFRTGRPIRHPVTKAILGNREEPLGRMAVTEVRDKEADGEIKELLVTRVVTGDIARLSTDKARLLLGVPGKGYNELAADRLFTLLKDSGRFDVVGTETLPDSEFSPGEAGKLIAGKDARWLVTIATEPTKRPDRTKVEVKLYGQDGAVVERQGGTVDTTSDVYKEKVMEYPLVKGERRDFFHTEDLPYRARHMAAGNITGEGKTELAVSDGRKLIVYRLEGGSMKELWRDDGQTTDEHLDVECADLNGNGKDEIYVTNFVNGRLESYVIEYDGTSFKRIAGPEPLFFRVLDVPGAGKKLITAELGQDAPYSGTMDEYKWAGGKLVKAGRFSLPAKIKDPYGFVLMDMPKDQLGGKKASSGPYIVWIDDDDYLHVMDSKGKRLWKSPERYGGYDNFFEREAKTMAIEGSDNRGKVKGRLIVRDGAEGEKEIVLTKNIPLTHLIRRVKGYSGAEIYSLAWEKGGMVTRWSIKNIDGYLADMSVGGVTNSGREEIAIITDPTFKVLKKSKSLPMGSVASVKDLFADRSSLMIYKIPQR